MDFKTTIDRIRNAIYGVEVRESIAVMGECLEEYFLDCASKIGDAIQSAKDAAASASEAKRALSDTKEAKADAVEAIEAAETDALTNVANATTDAQTAARNASNSAAAAAKSETNAGTKATEAAGSACAAEASAKAAEASANKAAAAVGTDKTLSIADVPADSKTVGDVLDGKLETGSAGYVKSVSVSGNTMTITKGDGTSLSEQLAESYTLPAATAETLGGVKVGENLSIDASGLLSGLADSGEIVASSFPDELSTTKDIIGYIRFSNGIQICGGRADGCDITFPVPFIDTNIMISMYSYKSLTITTTSVHGSGSIVLGHVIAIGRWK